MSKPLSAAHSTLVEKLVSLGVDRAAVLELLAKWGEWALQTAIYLLSGAVPPIPAPLQAKAGAGEACCDHAGCCCEINTHLAKAIEKGCGHCCPECDHCQCATAVAEEIGKAYCLALQHLATCQDGGDCKPSCG